MKLFSSKTKTYLSSVRDRYLTTDEARSPEFEETIPSTLSLDKGKIKLLFYVTNSLSYGSPRPVIFNIHGGNYVSGTPQDNARWTSIACDKGYAVVSVGYRLMPKHDRATAVCDCVDALLWLSQNAKRFNLDQQSIGISGFEVGGQIALEMVARLQEMAKAPPVAIKSIVLFEPVFNLDRFEASGSEGKSRSISGQVHQSSILPEITVLTKALYPKDQEVQDLQRKCPSLCSAISYHTIDTQAIIQPQTSRTQEDHVRQLMYREGLRFLNNALFSSEAASRAQRLNTSALDNQNLVVLSQ